MGAPNYGDYGAEPRLKTLLVGSLETAVRVVGTIENTLAEAVTFALGAILVRRSSGKYLPLVAAELDAPGGLTAVADEAVGNGDATTVTFTLAHAPVAVAGLAVTVAGAATEVTLNPTTGTITFATAPAESAAIVASYSYFALEGGIFPGGVVSVLHEEVAVTAESTATGQIVLNGQVAEDLLSLNGTAWADLSATTQEKVRNLLAASGITVCAVKR